VGFISKTECGERAEALLKPFPGTTGEKI